MRTYILILLLCGCIISLTTYAQKPQLSFNGAGQLAGSPPEELRGILDDELHITVSADQLSYQLYFKDLISKLETTYKKLDNPLLLNTLELYGIQKKQATALKNEIAIYLNAFPKGIWRTNSEIIGVPVNIFFPPSDTLFNNIYNITALLQSNEVGSTLTPYKLGLQIKPNVFVTNIPITEPASSLDLSLRIYNPVNVLISKTLQIQKAQAHIPGKLELAVLNLKLSKLKQLMSEFKKTVLSASDTSVVKELKVYLAKEPDPNDSLVRDTVCNFIDHKLSPTAKKTYLAVGTNYLSITDELNKYSNFFLSMLWYNQGKFAINPFLRKDNQIKKAQKEADSLESEIDSLQIVQNQLALRDSTLKTLLQKTRTLSKNDYLEITDKLVTGRGILKRNTKQLDSALSDLNDQKDEVSSQKTKLSQETVALKNKGAFLNSCKILLSDLRPINWMRHHDAVSNYQLMTLRTKREYPETDFVHVLVHNNRDSINIQSVSTGIKEVSQLQEETTDPLKELGGLSSHLTSFLDKFAKNAPDPNKLVDSCKNNINLIVGALRFIDNEDEIITFLSTQLIEIVLPSADEISEKPIYFSQHENVILDTLSPRKVTYTITSLKNKDKFTFSSQYLVNKLYRFLPAAGVMNSSYPYSTITIENGVIKTQPEGGIIAMAGLKVYPWRTLLRDPYFFISKKHNRRPIVDYRKIHALIGVNMLRPTRSFVLGLGVDLFSGIAVQGGFHLVRGSQPILEKNQVTGTRDFLGHGYFFGLSIDPAVFLNLINLF